MNNNNDNNEYDNYDEYSIKSVSIRDDTNIYNNTNNLSHNN